MMTGQQQLPSGYRREQTPAVHCGNIEASTKKVRGPADAVNQATRLRDGNAGLEP